MARLATLRPIRRRFTNALRILRRGSIRRRILVTFTTLTLVGGGIQIIIAGRELQDATMEYNQHDLETHALVAASVFAEPLGAIAEGESQHPASFLQRPLAALQVELQPHEFAVLDARDRIIAYKGAINELGNEAFGEIGALSLARSAPVGSSYEGEFLYVASPIRYESNILGYFLIREPLSDIYAQANGRWLELLVAMLPAAALIILASVWVARTISQPIEVLRDSALRIANGALDLRIAVKSRDEVGQFAQAFNYMAEQLESLMKTQRSFVSNAAHELRSPLTALSLRLEALEDSSLSAERRAQYLEEVRHDTDHMVNMVASLLTLARADEGKLVDENGGQYDGMALLHDLARRWRIEAGRAGLNFEARLPQALPDLPIPANQLRLIVDNLLSNAVKYTPNGKVAFEVRHDASTLHLAVTDTGLGFTPDEGANLFNRFYRTDTARAARVGGAGLGLAILQAVVSHHGGSVSASSPGVGQGARFEVVLPLGDRSAGERRAERDASLTFVSDVR